MTSGGLVVLLAVIVLLIAAITSLMQTIRNISQLKGQLAIHISGCPRVDVVETS